MWVSITLLWWCLSSAGTGRLVRIKGKINAALYRAMFDENLLQKALDLRLERRCTFQRNNNPKHTTKIKKGVTVNVLEWPRQTIF